MQVHLYEALHDEDEEVIIMKFYDITSIEDLYKFLPMNYKAIVKSDKKSFTGHVSSNPSIMRKEVAKYLLENKLVHLQSNYVPGQLRLKDVIVI